MTTHLLLAFAAFIAISVWVAISQSVRINRTRRQQEIAARGACCEGRVVAIQRPFMLDRCTRLYVDFQPLGAHGPVRACHIEGHSADELNAALPSTGSMVTVRYLPESPRQAVIGQLVRAAA